jgi:hypothetical protein
MDDLWRSRDFWCELKKFVKEQGLFSIRLTEKQVDGMRYCCYNPGDGPAPGLKAFNALGLNILVID